MNLIKFRFLMFVALGMFAFQPASFAKKKKKKWHCEMKKGDEVVDVDMIKSRKKCKRAGGKWVKEHKHGHKGHKGHKHGKKDHDHDDHDHDDHDHDH